MLNIKEKHDKCWFCENYYGSNFNEPVCSTCHYFLFPTLLEHDFDTATNGTQNTNKTGNSRTTVSQASSTADFQGPRTSSASARASVIVLSRLEIQNRVESLNGNRPRYFVEKLESNDSGNEDSDTYDQIAASRSPPCSFENPPESASSALREPGASPSVAAQSSTLTNSEDYDQQSNEQLPNCQERPNQDGGPFVKLQTAFITTPPNSSYANINNNYISNVVNINSINQSVVPLTSKACLSFTISSKQDPLAERILALSVSTSREFRQLPSNVIESLPTEVLLTIFRNLDDLALWSVSLVCKRWYQLICQEISQNQWKSFIKKRWFLYKPSVKINCYQTLYSQLVQSSNCFYCLQQINNRCNVYHKEELNKSWRHKRLLLELKALQQDPPDGIMAKPLDNSCYYWQASITGPQGSPYEGGIFFLYLQIPQSYPLNPPLVRFITKIYHPNISKHGDIGLDSIHDNWSLALTISKVLISIQSLLTDPYTHVCMENEIGQLYRTNRTLYEQKAKLYTWKYAMSDFLTFDDHTTLDKYFKAMTSDTEQVPDEDEESDTDE